MLIVSMKCILINLSIIISKANCSIYHYLVSLEERKKKIYTHRIKNLRTFILLILFLSIIPTYTYTTLTENLKKISPAISKKKKKKKES